MTENLPSHMNWVPGAQVAKILRVSRQRVNYLVQTGALLSVKTGGTRLISVRSVQSYMVVRDKVRRKRYANR